MSNVYDHYTDELRKFFLRSIRSVVPGEDLNSFYERKVSSVQTKKTQLNLFSLPNESCHVSCIFFRYRGAKLINCLIETGLGTFDFSIRINRKTLKHMQHVKVESHFLKSVFNDNAHYVL